MVTGVWHHANLQLSILLVYFFPTESVIAIGIITDISFVVIYGKTIGVLEDVQEGSIIWFFAEFPSG